MIKTNRAIRSKILITFTIFFIVLFSFFTVSINYVNAATIEELQAKIEEKNKNIEALNKEIQLYADLTDKTSKEAITLQNKIKTLTSNGKRLDADIKQTKVKIDKANLAIQKLGLNIKESEDKTSKFRETLGKDLQNIQFTESNTLIENILNKKNLSEALIEIDNLVQLNSKINDLIGELRSEKKVLVQNKVDKEEVKKELTTLQIELSGKKKVVEENKKEQSQILKETKNQEKTYQQILAQRKQEKEQLEKELFDYESTLKYTLNPSIIPKNSSDRPYSWPLDNVRITQLFGKTSASKRLYASGSHNGVDFGAKTGTPAKAVLSGTIIGAGDTDLTCKGASFGRWVLIKHDNGLATIYGHLSVISVTEGQRVNTGDIIGYTGNTGYSTGPHLHISVYDGNAVKVENRPSVSCGGKVYRMPIAPIQAYLDPMVYFPKN